MRAAYRGAAKANMAPVWKHSTRGARPVRYLGPRIGCFCRASAPTVAGSAGDRGAVCARASVASAQTDMAITTKRMACIPISNVNDPKGLA